MNNDKGVNPTRGYTFVGNYTPNIGAPEYIKIYKANINVPKVRNVQKYNNGKGL